MGGGGVYGETDRPNKLLNLVEQSDSMMDLSSISRYYSVLILAKTHEILKLELHKR